MSNRFAKNIPTNTNDPDTPEQNNIRATNNPSTAGYTDDMFGSSLENYYQYVRFQLVKEPGQLLPLMQLLIGFPLREGKHLQTVHSLLEAGDVLDAIAYLKRSNAPAIHPLIASLYVWETDEELAYYLLRFLLFVKVADLPTWAKSYMSAKNRATLVPRVIYSAQFI